MSARRSSRLNPKEEKKQQQIVAVPVLLLSEEEEIAEVSRVGTVSSDGIANQRRRLNIAHIDDSVLLCGAILLGCHSVDIVDTKTSHQTQENSRWIHTHFFYLFYLHGFFFLVQQVCSLDT